MTTRTLVAAGLYLVPAILFTEIARQLWTYRRVRRPRNQLFKLIPIVATVLAVHYLVLVARALVPGALSPNPMREILTPWHAEIEVSWILSLVLVRHLLKLTPVPEQPPSATWLAGNYGLGLAGAIALLAFRLWPGATEAHQILAHRVFEITFTTFGLLCFKQFRRNARPGRWGPEAAGEMRGPDVRLVRIGLVSAFLAVPTIWLAGGGEFAMIAFEVLMGLAIAAPIATRMAGHVLPGFVVTYTLFAATAVVLVAYSRVFASIPVAYRPLLGAGTVLVVLAIASEGQMLLRAGVARLFLRRRWRRALELQHYMQTLSPEIGVVECCRRTLAELVRVRQLPGAAILFADGEALVDGTFDLEPLRRVWPCGAAAAALPPGTYGTVELRELPLELREALIQSNVSLGAAAIRSRRRHWGHLFMNTGFFGGTIREDDAETFATFVDQLALHLDAADLLARTVAVERSLAHAEKLAAIGELAARFAHDIRNPVTAARSLAQQLARDPTAPENAEHAGIILEELERVERQVRDLLRFARREELRFEPVDLGALLRAMLARLRPRLDAAGVTAEVAAPHGLVVRGDRDKLDQVLVNLVENAADAMAETSERRLTFALGAENGTVAMRISDTGPGVPADALPRLFEPFYSRKANGTGLGLAIAKRTIDAHGGRIAADQRPGSGLAFTIELPVERGDA
jgi:signal transduction histidine kinase